MDLFSIQLSLEEQIKRIKVEFQDIWQINVQLLQELIVLVKHQQLNSVKP